MLFVEKDSSDPLQKDVKQVEIKSKTITEPKRKTYKWKLIWKNIIFNALMHLGGLYGIYHIVTLNANWRTILWSYFLTIMGLQGITSGAHRLWSHRAYKAKFPLRIFLAVCNTVALQSSIYSWSRHHRVHHKYVDTDADPHNSKRGLCFSHLGWVFIESTREAIEKIEAVDMSDLHEDGVVMFQEKYYFTVLAPVVGFYLPTWVPWYFWGENFWTSFFVATCLRYVLVLNFIFLVNSIAHKYGSRPYDRNIASTDNITVAMLTGGEGWHNYHHTFPWDYKAGELGNYSTNWSTGLIDFMARIGWAYNLKTVSVEMIKKRVGRTGDGTRKFEDSVTNGDQKVEDKEETVLWGWGDRDMTDNDMKFVEIHHRKSS